MKLVQVPRTMRGALSRKGTHRNEAGRSFVDAAVLDVGVVGPPIHLSPDTLTRLVQADDAAQRAELGRLRIRSGAVPFAAVAGAWDSYQTWLDVGCPAQDGRQLRRSHFGRPNRSVWQAGLVVELDVDGQVTAGGMRDDSYTARVARVCTVMRRAGFTPLQELRHGPGDSVPFLNLAPWPLASLVEGFEDEEGLDVYDQVGAAACAMLGVSVGAGEIDRLVQAHLVRDGYAVEVTGKLGNQERQRLSRLGVQGVERGPGVILGEIQRLGIGTGTI